jgi:hypothetical protein
VLAVVVGLEKVVRLVAVGLAVVVPVDSMLREQPEA